MRTHTVITAALTIAALAFAGCSDEPTAADANADRDKQARDAQLAFARCMREHGIDMPDPQPGQRGIRLTAPEGVSPQKMDEADKACRKHLEGLRGPELSEEQQKEFQEAALAHARCMREHGIDMPDPTFGENGQATVRIRRGAGASGPDPEDPEFKAAEEACRDELPQLDGEGPSTEKAP